ncbi:MAG: YlzJ-like family protein [Halanaerobiales bacterium]
MYPPENIFSGHEKTSPEYKTVSLNNNLKVVVEKLGSGNYKIDRIISSKPENYLRPEIAPGNIFSTEDLLNIYFGKNPR